MCHTRCTRKGRVRMPVILAGASPGYSASKASSSSLPGSPLRFPPTLTRQWEHVQVLVHRGQLRYKPNGHELGKFQGAILRGARETNGGERRTRRARLWRG